MVDKWNPRVADDNAPPLPPLHRYLSGMYTLVTMHFSSRYMLVPSHSSHMSSHTSSPCRCRNVVLFFSFFSLAVEGESSQAEYLEFLICNQSSGDLLHACFLFFSSLMAFFCMHLFLMSCSLIFLCFYVLML